MVNRRLRRRPSIELTLGQDIVFSRTLWSAVEKKAKSKKKNTLAEKVYNYRDYVYHVHQMVQRNYSVKKSTFEAVCTTQGRYHQESRIIRGTSGESTIREKTPNKIVKTLPK